MTQAIKEMFETTHMQLLANASRLELMLLVAVALEMRAASRNDVVLLAAGKRLVDTVCSWTNDDKPCSGEGRAAGWLACALHAASGMARGWPCVQLLAASCTCLCLWHLHMLVQAGCSSIQCLQLSR